MINPDLISEQANASESVNPTRYEDSANAFDVARTMMAAHEKKDITFSRTDDYDHAVVVFLGEPYPREVCEVGGACVPFTMQHKKNGMVPVLRIAINVAIYETKAVKVFDCTSRTFKDILHVRDKYELHHWAFDVIRATSEDGKKTVYSILPEIQLSPEKFAEFSALKLYDLPSLCNAVTP